MRLLVVEDDKILAEGLVQALTQAGYAVDHAANGEIANVFLQQTAYDLVVLDLGLPKLDGFEVLKRMRSRGDNSAVMILTAQDAIESRVKGLDLGADDYLIKPLDLTELEARVRALIRRGKLGSNASLVCGDLAFNAADKRASCGDKDLLLSTRELALLEILMHKQNKVVSKEQVLESLCNWDSEIGDYAIEVYIHRLRKKIAPANVQIRTIRGLGYLLEDARKPA
jgi:two-component system OmpR family response regulator